MFRIVIPYIPCSFHYLGTQPNRNPYITCISDCYIFNYLCRRCHYSQGTGSSFPGLWIRNINSLITTKTLLKKDHMNGVKMWQTIYSAYMYLWFKKNKILNVFVFMFDSLPVCQQMRVQVIHVH